MVDIDIGPGLRRNGSLLTGYIKVYGWVEAGWYGYVHCASVLLWALLAMGRCWVSCRAGKWLLVCLERVGFWSMRAREVGGFAAGLFYAKVCLVALLMLAAECLVLGREIGRRFCCSTAEVELPGPLRRVSYGRCLESGCRSSRPLYTLIPAFWHCLRLAVECLVLG